LLFPNAIAWVYWRLHGNWLRHSIIAGSYAVAIVTCILFSVYFNPGSGVVGQWPEPLLVLQIVIMVYYGAFAVGQAVRRDVNNKQLDSHRLMPLSPAAGVLGYLFGPSIVAIEFGIIRRVDLKLDFQQRDHRRLCCLELDGHHGCRVCQSIRPGHHSRYGIRIDGPRGGGHCILRSIGGNHLPHFCGDARSTN
jgi:hypothetical protein